MTLQGNHFLGEAQIERLRPRVTFNLVNLWEVKRDDGVIIRLATTDKQVYFEGHWFLASGPSASDMEQGEALAEADFELTGVLDHENITAEDLYAGRYDKAKLTHWVVDLERPWVWFRHHVWFIKKITVVSGMFKAEIAGVERFLTVPIGRMYDKDCDKVLASQECGATNAPSIVSTVQTIPSTATGSHINGTILDTSALIIAHPGGGGFPLVPLVGDDQPPIWTFGSVEFTSGSNVGVIIPVGYETGSGTVGADMEITLAFPAPYNIRVGDGIIVVGGCDGTRFTCLGTFENEVNFGGQPEMPNTSTLYESPQQADVEELPCT
jgi:hypothetical protein